MRFLTCFCLYFLYIFIIFNCQLLFRTKFDQRFESVRRQEVYENEMHYEMPLYNDRDMNKDLCMLLLQRYGFEGTGICSIRLVLSWSNR